MEELRGKLKSSKEKINNKTKEKHQIQIQIERFKKELIEMLQQTGEGKGKKEATQIILKVCLFCLQAGLLVLITFDWATL